MNFVLFSIFQAITKIFWEMDSEGTTWTVFSGGMPRASYGDKSTVTVMKGKQTADFDVNNHKSNFYGIHFR